MTRTLGLLLLCGFGAACNGSAANNRPDSEGGGNGTVVKLDGLSSTAPASWKAGSPTSEMRMYQFVLPKADGDPLDAELIVFFFGKGGGGGIDANVQRWKEKFLPPEGKKIDDVTKVDKFKVGTVGV